LAENRRAGQSVEAAACRKKEPAIGDGSQVQEGVAA
jgi:hypothetical protein